MSRRPAAAGEPYDPDETVYVKNEHGAVHSCTRAHYAEYLTQRTNAGGVYPLPGWKVLTEAEARKEAPTMFGAPDPNIILNDSEVHRELMRAKELAELEALRRAAAGVAEADGE